MFRWHPLPGILGATVLDRGCRTRGCPASTGFSSGTVKDAFKVYGTDLLCQVFST